MNQTTNQHESTGLMIKRRILKPGQYRPREDAVDIFITDYELHAQTPNNPASLVRNTAKAHKSGKHSRTYGKSIRALDDGRIEATLDFDKEELLTYLRKNGKRMMRIYMPKDGVPVYLAEDAIEKLKSVQRKLNNQKPTQ